MVRSCVSAFVGIAACATSETLLAAPLEDDALVVEGTVGAPLPGPVTAGAVCAGRLACGRFVGGFGPKNLAHARITTRDRSEATTMRSSCVNLNFFSGSVTNAPRQGQRYCVESLARFPARDRTQICRTADGSEAAV